MTVPGCSAASLEAGESLAGTAVESVDRWLLLEVTEPWAPKALQTQALPETVRTRLGRWLEAPRSRLQLIRRPGRSGKRPLFMTICSNGDRPQTSKLELGRYEELVDLDLDALPAGPSEPICLVCAHGRRDRCCGVLGSAVFRAIQSQGVDTWQTSHLGGHRFAACALWLPDGLMYGRLRADHAQPWVAAHRAGEVGELDSFRGRCAYDRPTQAAEIFVRKRLGLQAADGIEWLATEETSESSWEVRFRIASGEEVVRLRLADTGATRPASCGGEAEAVTELVEE
ncbi:MAG: sucrase ferredoxin [Polyangiales bacterium]